MSRKAKLEKALAEKHYKETDILSSPLITIGRRVEMSRLSKLHVALIEAVEALECNQTFHRLGGIDDCEPCKALLKIDKALEEM